MNLLCYHPLIHYCHHHHHHHHCQCNTNTVVVGAHRNLKQWGKHGSQSCCPSLVHCSAGAHDNHQDQHHDHYNHHHDNHNCTKTISTNDIQCWTTLVGLLSIRNGGATGTRNILTGEKNTIVLIPCFQS